MTDSTDVREITTWDAMTDWLLDSFTDQPAGLIIDLGPNDDVHFDDIYDSAHETVMCAQLHVLADGVLMVRRSRTVLDRLRFASHAIDGADPSRWFFDDHFDDCTDGYLFTRDIALAAQACVSWFRDIPGAPTLKEIGCAYEFPDTLPPRRAPAP
ncbi:hypothetical protein ACWEQV_28855 [Rhodococcus aetherivorans]|uniref:hypothetical protein n=1 Tax=Rhodococcus aetherivorans TaxID=191292 RepID=UPI002949704D|nr:hypothetical protein [Rhodococcus aetherivorans]MDV6297368.1 hypothetical protein [Rhodococcus aetherivorans]